MQGRVFTSFALIAATAAAPAATQEPGMLQRLEPGQWELRDIGDERVLRASICVGDPLLLVQSQHGTASCTRTIISSSERETTIHYTCPPGGFGRTTVRYETPRLARVESQGIYRSAPFGFRAEARRVGPCGGGNGTAR